MPELDYAQLSRQQKLAVFLIVIGPDAAAEVLRQFSDPDVEQICREMSEFTLIPQDVQKLALDEFAGLVAQGVGCAVGGIGFAQKTLEIAKGDYRASTIVRRIGPVGGPSAEMVKDVAEMDGRQIYNLVKNEQPQTIAFLLSYLDSGKAAEAFSLLSADLREEVIERLGSIESTSLELLNKIARNLGRHTSRKALPAFHHTGGVHAVADLLKQLGKEASKGLLNRLEERNATLGAAIRKKLFSFEDLMRIQPVDLQRVLREVDSANLALAMKSVSAPLREKIYGAISKRAAEGLKQEVELLGAVRLKDVEAAQDAITQVVRRLEEEGQLSLDSQGADSLVA